MKFQDKIDNSNKIFIFSVFFLSLAIKLIFKVNYFEDYDAINFAYGLKEYDLFIYKPHFPGYPVYILLGRVLFFFIRDETLALVTLNVLSGAISTAMVYLIAYELFDKKTGLLSALVFTVNPTISILSTSVNSDIPALLFLLIFLYFLVAAEKHIEKRVKYAFISSFFFGMTLGIRFSYLPFLVLWLVFSKFFSLFRLKDYEYINLDDNTFLASIGGLALGGLLWLLPLLYIVGINNYYYEGIRFISGHFSSWGGTYFTQPSSIKRVAALLWQLFPNGMGLYYYDTAITRIIPTAIFLYAFFYWLKRDFKVFWRNLSTPIVAVEKSPDINAAELGNVSTEAKEGESVSLKAETSPITSTSSSEENEKKNQTVMLVKTFLLFTLPYLIWILLAQNLQKARHIIPLIPVLIIYLSYTVTSAFNSKKYGYVIISFMLVFMLTDTVFLLSEHKKKPSPPYRIMKYLTENSSIYDSVLYCDDIQERFFSYYNRKYMVKQAHTAGEVLKDLDESIIEQSNIYVISEVKDAASMDVQEVISFSSSPYLCFPPNKITLYKLNREGVNLLDF